MSAKIGEVHGPASNSPSIVVEMFASLAGAEMRVLKHEQHVTLDPIAARNLAALLVRAADECERMRDRRST